jgi:bifunctional non-homologous end joining protein LigD
MGLTTYKKKRVFNETPEPTGGKSAGAAHTFVVQKHAASHLHYDFRLEIDGVLKSWAVPKGPSMDPTVKRLAMMVEDHPYDYRTFEGTIPEGNYGAGTVMVWDEGAYAAADGPFASKKEEDKALLHQLHAGKLKFVMLGEKLKGEFALVKTSARGENAWLLMKTNDEYATADDILLKDRSAKSGKTLDQIQTKRAPKKTAAKKAATRKTAAKKTTARKKS